MPTILVTGFGPFPGAPFNPTGPLVERLARLRRPALAHAKIVSHIFPTSYAAVDRDLPKLHRAAQAGCAADVRAGAAGVAPCASRRARATRVSLLPDAGGVALRRLTIAAGGPQALAMPAPARRLLAAVRAAGVPAALSRDAGRYLCNYLCWRAAEAAGEQGRSASRRFRACAEGGAHGAAAGKAAQASRSAISARAGAALLVAVARARHV